MAREIEAADWQRFNFETAKYAQHGGKLRLRFEIHKLPDANAYGVAFVWAYDASAPREAMLECVRRFLADLEAGKLEGG